MFRKRELVLPNDQKFGIHKRFSSKIKGKKLEIGRGQGADSFGGSEFEDCEIRIYSGGRSTGVMLDDCHFNNCLIWASKKQIIPTWQASFKECVFKGKYEVRFPSKVEDCDFSIATLYSASFQQSEALGKVIWPQYPHVIISDAISNYQDWKKIPKPKEFNQYIIHPKTKGNLVVINLAHAVEKPDDFWQIIKVKKYVSSILQESKHV